MVEEVVPKILTRIKSLFYVDRPLFVRLMEKLVQGLIAYVQMQIAAAPMRCRSSTPGPA